MIPTTTAEAQARLDDVDRMGRRLTVLETIAHHYRVRRRRRTRLALIVSRLRIVGSHSGRN